MDFSYSDEQQMLQDSIRKFVQNQYDFDTRRKILNSAKGYSEENWALFAELGWLTVPFLEQDDGFGAAACDLVVMMEEFGKAMVVEPFLPTAVISGGLISELAEGELRSQLIGSVMDGSTQYATAFAEPGSRYNLASVATRAERNASGYLVNGAKIVVLNGAGADQLLLVARTSGEERDQQGISVLLVPAQSQGVQRKSYRAVDGHAAAEIRFDNVQVPASALLGEAGAALPAVERVIDRATLAVCAEAVGAMDCLLNKTVEYAKTRKQFGTTIGSFQALQHRMADMFIECQLARSVVMMAAMTLDGSASDAEKARAISAAKSRAGKAMRKVGQEAVQLHGGIAVTDELDVGHLFKRTTTIERLFGNTDHHTRRYASL